MTLDELRERVQAALEYRDRKRRFRRNPAADKEFIEKILIAASVHADTESRRLKARVTELEAQLTTPPVRPYHQLRLASGGYAWCSCDAAADHEEAPKPKPVARRKPMTTPGQRGDSRVHLYQEGTGLTACGHKSAGLVHVAADDATQVTCEKCIDTVAYRALTAPRPAPGRTRKPASKPEESS